MATGGNWKCDLPNPGFRRLGNYLISRQVLSNTETAIHDQNTMNRINHLKKAMMKVTVSSSTSALDICFRFCLLRNYYILLILLARMKQGYLKILTFNVNVCYHYIERTFVQK